MKRATSHDRAAKRGVSMERTCGRVAGLAFVIISTVFLLASCPGSTGSSRTPITSGTISGFAFTVIDGKIFQDVEDGPIDAEDEGGIIAFDEDTTGLGMSIPDRLQLRTQFSLQPGGKLVPAAFGDTANLLAGGLWMELSRDGTNIRYKMGSGTAEGLSGPFSPGPADAGAAIWVVSEYYNASTPGYGSVSGITIWHLDDLSPTFCGEQIEQHDLDDPPGGFYRVGIALRLATLHAVSTVDPVIGPCE